MNARKRTAYWRQFHVYHITLENAWTERIQAALKQQLSPFVAHIRLYGLEDAVMRLESLIQGDPIRAVLIKLYTTIFPVYANTVTNQLEDEYGKELTRRKFFGTTNDFWLSLVNDYIRTYTANKVVDITDTTKELIRRQIAAGLEQQLSIDDMIQLILDNSINPYRARAIARTEITGILNAAAQGAALQTGLLLRKVWISSLDFRTRRLPVSKFDHYKMDGVTEPITHPFNVNGDLIDYPGDPKGAKGNIIQCRCTHAHEAVRDSNGRLIRNEFTSVVPSRASAGLTRIIGI